MTDRKLELVYLRAIVCTVIVLTHILTTYTVQEAGDAIEFKYLYVFRNIFIFGVPSFLILSQLLMTLRYEYIPKNFLRKRIAYIIIPYLTVGLIYSFMMKQYNDLTLWDSFKSYALFGNWYGYFIIIFFQIILFNLIFKKIPLRIFGHWWVVLIALIIQAAFFYFRFTNAAFENWLIHDYPFNENTFFLGWIFYYFLGGYVGRHYTGVIKFLENYLVLVITAAIITFVGFLIIFDHDYYTVQSFAGKLIPYHTLMFFLMLGTCLHFKTLAYNYVIWVAHFSYLIYLMHPIYLNSVYDITKVFLDSTVILMIVTLFVIQSSIIGLGLFLHSFTLTRWLFGTRDFRYLLKDV